MPSERDLAIHRKLLVSDIFIPESETVHQKCYERRDVVYRHGDGAAYFYKQLSGFIAIELYMKDGRRQLAEIDFPGEIFGFTPEEAHHDTAVALQASTVRIMSQADLQFGEAACMDVTRRLGRQLRKSHDHVLTMGRKTAEQRVCHLLSQLADASEQHDAPYPAQCGAIRLQVPLTRGEMADYLGLSLETVCRTMTCLQRKCLIEIGPRQRDVTLLRPDKLRTMAG